MERNNKYPVILVHGFMGYGDEDGVSRFLSGWGFSLTKNAVKYLNKNGYETYGPAVGPINNAWDRTCELYARLSAVDRHPTHQDDEGSARTHDQRVCKYTQCLYQSLLHRVRHMRCGSSVWRRTFTSLIAEQSSLDTLHHSRTKSSAQSLFPAESTAEDSCHHLWNTMQVEHHDTNSNQEVGDSHERHYGRTNLRYAMYASEYY